MYRSYHTEWSRSMTEVRIGTMPKHVLAMTEVRWGNAKACVSRQLIVVWSSLNEPWVLINQVKGVMVNGIRTNLR